MMPGLSGLDVLRRVRETHPPSALPVVMVTARTESEDIVEALELGANDYVTKPIDFPVVLARVKAQLRMRTRRPAAPTEPQLPAHVGPGSILASPLPHGVDDRHRQLRHGLQGHAPRAPDHGGREGPGRRASPPTPTPSAASAAKASRPAG